MTFTNVVRWIAVVSFCQLILFALLGAWSTDPSLRESSNKTAGLALAVHLISLIVLAAHWYAYRDRR